MFWTRATPKPGDVHMIVLRESHARGKLIFAGWLYHPNGWESLARCGWLRSSAPVPVGEKRPPLASVPVHLKN